MRTTSIKLSRTIGIPDSRRLARRQRAPDLGPRLLFFSGGTALRGVSQRLIDYTHNSIHLITPFDSGGSSAELRNAFHMLSVGDLRNRLMALADHSIHGQPEVFRLFSFRFPDDEPQPRLRRWLARMIRGEDLMVAAISEPMQQIVCQHLRFFHEKMPASFDLRGANIGNLILAGGFLNQERDIDSVVYLFSKLVEVRGVVRPITDEDLHLVAELESGELVVGQHHLTGKEEAPLTSPIRRLFLSQRGHAPHPYTLDLRDKIRRLIMSADLVCYPMGSFFSSVLVNLLPRGIGRAVAALDVPKVYVPNTVHDPEQLGLSLPMRAERLLDALRAGEEEELPTERLLSHVVVDTAGAGWAASDLSAVERLGVRVIDTPLTRRGTAPMVDAERLAQVLVSIA